MKELHLLIDKNLIGRQFITIWMILTVGAIVAATLAVVLTTYGMNSEISIAISLIIIGIIVVLSHLKLYRSGYLPFRVLSASALFYPFKAEDGQIIAHSESTRNDDPFANFLNLDLESGELVTNTLKALLAERQAKVNEGGSRGINRQYLQDFKKIYQLMAEDRFMLQEISPSEYRARVKRRYLNLIDDLEKSHQRRKIKYPLISEWSHAREVVGGQPKAEEMIYRAFLESIKNLPARQPRISLLSYVSGVNPVDVASTLNIHPTEVPRWYDLGLRFLQEDRGLARKLQSISNDVL